MIIRPKIFAHRGASRYAPENTFPAFELAYELGADGIELDVQLSKDQIPVIIHDENLRRTTNGSGFVQDYTFEELSQFDAGSWFSKHYQSTKIPSLEQFLRWVEPKNLIVNIELKTNVLEYQGIEEIIDGLINQFNLSDRTIVSSFNDATIRNLRNINEDLTLAWLTKKRWRDITQLLKDIGANDIHIKSTLLPSGMRKSIQEHEIPFRVYTVNRPITMRKCWQLGADGIVTDVPDIAKKTLQ
ncbi:glycerophosphodiester phosphodiesterase [Halalkalibacillus sediminis]|uniref:Glycerophosphodiester phosphodiesterase n=1 Tax=Halalkalibacillus sediminis TaxID=2018042 RepID=A0A2I0QX89_9BACI|nr:glycerophosphodiester phosphodiesterase [Halalkalibacillus sediminis]PKR78918.1 glycerophosphodiester phosphodiesterase [Halalkalibacillus sediminis]